MHSPFGREASSASGAVTITSLSEGIFMSGRVTANLPSRDFEETSRFYKALGFEKVFRDDGWMILGRGTLKIEFFPHPELVSGDSWFSVCVRVNDLDMLYALWKQANLPEVGMPRLCSPEQMPNGFRMFALIDCNGSLLRCLSPTQVEVPTSASQSDS